MVHGSLRTALASKVFLKIRLHAPWRGFSATNVTLLGGNVCAIIFSRRELSSRRENYQDFSSRQDSQRDPGGDFFTWRDPSENRYEIPGGNFS